MKLNTVTPVVGTISTTGSSAVTTATPGNEPQPGPSEKKSEFTVGGRSTVSSSSSGGDFKKPGWTTVSNPPKPGLTLLPPPPEAPHATTVPLPPMTPTSSFRSGGWTTLEGPPSASTPNRPLTSNVDHPIPLQHPAPFPLEPAPIQNPPEPWTSGFKSAGVRPQFTSQLAKNRSPSKRAEASCSGWQSINRGGSRR